LRFIEVQQCTAEYIYRAITKQLFQEIGAPKTNLIGFAAGNALVMTGEQGRVQAKLSEDCQSLFVFGCLCHSIHLCASINLRTFSHYNSNVWKPHQNYRKLNSPPVCNFSNYYSFPYVDQ